MTFLPIRRRAIATGLLSLALPPLVGCASAPPPTPEPDGRLCHRSGKRSWHHITCTTAPVPVDVGLAALPADGQALTVYVLRGGWGDSRGRVLLHLDERPVAESVPLSFVRLRLQPGRHRAVSEWTGGRSETEFAGAAGAVLFMALEPPAWSWSRPFAWVRLSAPQARERASSGRLVADVDRRQ